MQKLKEVLYSVLPITFMVLVLNFTITPLETPLLIRFLLGSLFIILGLSIFLFGVDIGITPIGNLMGSGIAKSNKTWFIIVAGFILGFVISVAEPDLHILAGRVDSLTNSVITKTSIVIVVSIGIAALLSTGLIKIAYNIRLPRLLTILYLIIFVLCLFSSPIFLAISFDASGATTGAITVPFILAIAAGVSTLKKDSKVSEEDSFGLVGIVSAGAIMTVLLMSVISKVSDITGSLDYNTLDYPSIIAPFIEVFPTILYESFLALFPILVIFLIFKRRFKLSRKATGKILKGVLYTYIGLVLFMVGVNAGFMDVGSLIGYKLAKLDNDFILIGIAFILGLVTVLAEPAVHVLTYQVENITSGYVKRSAVLSALSVGIGLSLALSMIRIMVPGIQLWHYLLPGYIISIIMTYFVPELFVGIAFDSGGVASGPMTATFVLAFAQGAAEAIEGADVLIDGFGIIAMVALTPLITLQILGLIFKIKSKKEVIKQDGE